MVKPNAICPICESKLTEQNVARKDWLESKPIKLDYAGRAICKDCAEWIENTEWD